MKDRLLALNTGSCDGHTDVAITAPGVLRRGLFYLGSGVTKVRVAAAEGTRLRSAAEPSQNHTPPLLLANRVCRVYDDYVAERSLVPSTAATKQRRSVLLAIQMQRRDHPAITLGFTQRGIDKVHAVIRQPAFIHQVILDAAGTVLP